MRRLNVELLADLVRESFLKYKEKYGDLIVKKALNNVKIPFLFI